jgi:hypothetical protein
LCLRHRRCTKFRSPTKRLRFSFRRKAKWAKHISPRPQTWRAPAMPAMGFARLALFVALVFVSPSFATALPILRAPRPVVDPVEAASVHFGVSLKSSFGGSSPRRKPDNKLGATTTALTHRVEGSGFHRKVHVEFTGELPVTLLPVVTEGKCFAVFVTQLDAHLYADRFELASLFRHKKNADARVFERAFTISEKAAPECNASVVAVMTPITVDAGARGALHHKKGAKPRKQNKFGVTAFAEYPLHNRYPGPVATMNSSTQGLSWFQAFVDVLFSPRPYVVVDLDVPSVLVRCGRNELLVSDKNNKDLPGGGWSASSLTRGASVSPKAVWSIPAGSLAHARFIGVATHLVRYVTAGFVLRAVWNAKRPSLKKKKE